MTNWVIIAAGGQGQRMELGFNKIFAKLGRFPVIYWTLAAFEKSKVVDNIIICAGENDIAKIRAVVKGSKFKKIRQIVAAGKSRQESTLNVLKAFKNKILGSDLVGVHNAVNPFVTEDEIQKVYKNAKLFGAALLAQAARDTVKITDGEGFVAETPLRKYSWYAQTPQVATFENLYKAHLQAREDKFVGTDDAQLLERIGIKPKVVPCSNENFKITFTQDLAMARYILSSKFNPFDKLRVDAEQSRSIKVQS